VSLVLAWAGTAFASRRGLHGTASWLAALSGLAAFAFLGECGLPLSRAAATGVLAAALPTLAAAFAWGCRRPGTRPIPTSDAKRIPWKRAALSTVSALSILVVSLAQSLLLQAAAFNLTGPMLLATIGKMGLYRVSDLAFSEALLADQYLWRDEPASSKHVAAASPARFVRLMRTGRDRWSGAELVAASHAREARRPKGVGLVYGPESADGLRVSYVYPGSPAEAAGIRRGDVVRAIDGAPVGAGAAPSGPRRVGSTRIAFAASSHERGEVTIAWAEYPRRAVTVERVIEAAGRRVGYLLLHDFDPSAGPEFADAAARLREQGVDDLVLDLRTNPGGSINAARDVASAIGGSRLDGKTFLRIVHSERYRDSDRDVAFRSHGQAALSLPRLFVITSGDSCSASEALINGLAPHVTVVTVGTPTCGKPVGMTVVEYGVWAYWVITFRVLNARNEGDYFAGLRPTCPAEEDFAHELGDPAEASLGAALHYISHGRCPDRSSAAAPE
jgi:hypothetical protein